MLFVGSMCAFLAISHAAISGAVITSGSVSHLWDSAPVVQPLMNFCGTFAMKSLVSLPIAASTAGVVIPLACKYALVFASMPALLHTVSMSTTAMALERGLAVIWDCSV